MSAGHPAHRGSILIEDARVLEQTAWADGQYVLLLHAPRIAAKAAPGAFVHLTCDPHLPMRRPLSLQRACPDKGTLEILYKVVGDGTRRLATARPGDVLSCMGPIGNGFSVDRSKRLPLLIGGGVGLPPMIYLAESLAQDPVYEPLVALGSEIPFPFNVTKSSLAVNGLPDSVWAAHPDLEAISMRSRLASLSNIEGSFRGYVTDLASSWIRSLSPSDQEQVAIYACGPTPMLAAVARLARQFNLSAQVSLEEYMACAVGGCAGCAVPVTTSEGTYMKRVCVDGPVFDAYQVFAEA